MKRLLLILGSVAVFPALGCRGTDPVVDRLPPPYHVDHSVTPTPSLPPKQVLPPPTTTSISGKTIIVDAGHGGKDPGAPARFGGAAEKFIVLSIAKEVARGLKARGAKVVMTRDRDVFIELDDRAAIAERHRADLFVSIHADAAQKATASGATFYIARNASTQSLRAALRLNRKFTQAGLPTRGVRRANYRVVAGHSRPAVLIECGFQTNRADAARLNSGSGRTQLANAIVAGIVDHFTQ